MESIVTMKGNLPISQPPIARIYQLLHGRWGPQHWWPADTPWEVMIGAVLTQNTSWTNVERAIAGMKGESILDCSTLAAMEESRLAAYLRPCGYFNIKVRRLKALAVFMRDKYGGDPERMRRHPTSNLRAELLDVHGVGPETADSILLYALGRPVFVIDAYTRRFLGRHGWVSPKAGYDDVAALFTRGKPADEAMFNEYHALIVRLGKEHCRGRPICEGCPLNELLPVGGTRI